MHCKTTVDRPTILFIFTFIYGFTSSLIDYTNPHCVKCPYSELFWSAFSRIRTEYGEMQSISLYSVRMRENTFQNNSEYGPFSRKVWFLYLCKFPIHQTSIFNVRNYTEVYFGTSSYVTLPLSMFFFLLPYLAYYYLHFKESLLATFFKQFICFLKSDWFINCHVQFLQ